MSFEAATPLPRYVIFGSGVASTSHLLWHQLEQRARGESRRGVLSTTKPLAGLVRPKRVKRTGRDISRRDVPKSANGEVIERRACLEIGIVAEGPLERAVGPEGQYVGHFEATAL